MYRFHLVKRGLDFFQQSIRFAQNFAIVQQALRHDAGVRESQTVHPVRFTLLLEAALTSWGKSRELNVTVIEYDPRWCALSEANVLQRLSASVFFPGFRNNFPRASLQPHFCPFVVALVQHRRVHAPLNNLSVGTLPLSILVHLPASGPVFYEPLYGHFVLLSGDRRSTLCPRWTREPFLRTKLN